MGSSCAISSSTNTIVLAMPAAQPSAIKSRSHSSLITPGAPIAEEEVTIPGAANEPSQQHQREKSLSQKKISLSRNASSVSINASAVPSSSSSHKSIRPVSDMTPIELSKLDSSSASATILQHTASQQYFRHPESSRVALSSSSSHSHHGGSMVNHPAASASSSSLSSSTFSPHPYLLSTSNSSTSLAYTSLRSLVLSFLTGPDSRLFSQVEHIEITDQELDELLVYGGAYTLYHLQHLNSLHIHFISFEELSRVVYYLNTKSLDVRERMYAYLNGIRIRYARRKGEGEQQQQQQQHKHIKTSRVTSLFSPPSSYPQGTQPINSSVPQKILSGGKKSKSSASSSAAASSPATFTWSDIDTLYIESLAGDIILDILMHLEASNTNLRLVEPYLPNLIQLIKAQFLQLHTRVMQERKEEYYREELMKIMKGYREFIQTLPGSNAWRRKQERSVAENAAVASVRGGRGGTTGGGSNMSTVSSTASISTPKVRPHAVSTTSSSSSSTRLLNQTPHSKTLNEEIKQQQQDENPYAYLDPLLNFFSSPHTQLFDKILPIRSNDLMHLLSLCGDEMDKCLWYLERINQCVCEGEGKKWKLISNEAGPTSSQPQVVKPFNSFQYLKECLYAMLCEEDESKIAVYHFMTKHDVGKRLIQPVVDDQENEQYQQQQQWFITIEHIEDMYRHLWHVLHSNSSSSSYPSAPTNLLHLIQSIPREVHFATIEDMTDYMKHMHVQEQQQKQ